MADSDFVFRSGTAINVGNHGSHDFVYQSGEPVFDGGGISWIRESGTGLGGQELNLDLQTTESINWATDDNGDEIVFSAGDYRITAEGAGYTHHVEPNKNYICPADEDELDSFQDSLESDDSTWFEAPCNRIEAKSDGSSNGGSIDDPLSMYYDIDGDGTVELMMGAALVYKGAPNFLDKFGRDAVSQTRVLTDKELAGADSRGEGTITLTEDSKFGVYNMDEDGSQGDNDGDVTYTIAPA